MTFKNSGENTGQNPDGDLECAGEESARGQNHKPESQIGIQRSCRAKKMERKTRVIVGWGQHGCSTSGEGANDDQIEASGMSKPQEVR